MKTSNIFYRLFLITALLSCSSSSGGDVAIAPDTSSPFGFHPAAVENEGYPNKGYTDAQEIGVTWTRPRLYAYWSIVQMDISSRAYEFSQYDTQYGSVPDGVMILANIAPAPPTVYTHTLSGSYLPVDESKYADFVKALVERYDGDGVGDMPGLINPIKYWQVGNEPSVLSAGGFPDLQRITYAAIKEACPDCKVLIGGAMVFMDESDYAAAFDDHYKPILDALAGHSVDIMDFHWYGNATGDYCGAADAYAHIRAVLNAAGFSGVSVWITEMGSYSGDPVASGSSFVDYPFQSERQQALDYVKRFVYPLSFGVKKIFPAFGLMEGQFDGGYFDNTGLIYDGVGTGDPGLGVKKLGYYAYKKMTEVLGGSDLNNIRTIRKADSVFLFRFMKNGKPVYVAWWDYFNDSSYPASQVKQVSLTDLPNVTVLVSEALPKYSTGQEVGDYAAAFEQYYTTVSSGSTTLTLGDSPVYVVVP